MGKGITRIEQLPYNGSFELMTILKHKENLAEKIDADWYIHNDADEIREAPMPPYKTLCEGIQDVDRMGYNAIDFDEFVFLPTSNEECYENTDFVREMRYYYFYKTGLLRQVKAWKNLKRRIDLTSWAGHQVLFRGRKIFPEKFIYRHYMTLSKNHAIKKYGEMVYSKYEVEKLRWHIGRTGFRKDNVVFPQKKDMCSIDTPGWDRTHPQAGRLFL
jgi:hypothetical protein